MKSAEPSAAQETNMRQRNSADSQSSRTDVAGQALWGEQKFQDDDEQEDDCRPTSPASLEDSNHSTDTTPLLETVLFFFSAVGCTLGWTAVLSNLVYYTDTLGLDSFLWLNLAVYAPLLPVTLAQALWDTVFDQKFKSLRSFFFRGFVAFFVTFLCILCLPRASQSSLLSLSITSTCLGLASAVLHGMLKQMAAFCYPDCGRLPAAVTAGMQASAVLVLMVSITSGFGHCGNKEGIDVFYFSIAGLLLVCWGCFQILLVYSRGVLRSMSRRDSLFLSTSNISTPSNDDDDENHHELEEALLPQPIVEELSLKELWIKTWPACLVIMLTVGSSMSVSSWFNRVQSQDPNNQSLPQVLFYTRLLADLFGRPATLMTKCSPTSSATLVTLAILRLAFVPIFFLYISNAFFPLNDVAAVVGVLMFAFTSGYLVTLSYQVAPTLLSTQERERSTMKQASLINVCFSASVLIGLAVSIGLKFVIA